MSTSAIQFGEDGQPLCFHTRPAQLLTSRTTTNPNRLFYCCHLQAGDPERCKFFSWKDLLSPMNSGVQPAGGISETPRKPHGSALSAYPTPSTSGVRKRDNGMREDVDDSLTPSQKRQKTIQQELSRMNKTGPSNGIKRSASSEMDHRLFGGAMAGSQPPSAPTRLSQRPNYDAGESRSIQSATLTHDRVPQPIPGSPGDPFTQFDEDDWDLLSPPSQVSSLQQSASQCRNVSLGGTRTLGSPVPIPSSPPKHPRASNVVDRTPPGSSEPLGGPANIASVARQLDFSVPSTESHGEFAAEQISRMIKSNLEQANHYDELARTHRENAKDLDALKAHVGKLEQKRKAAEQRAQWQTNHISKLKQEIEELRKK